MNSACSNIKVWCYICAAKLLLLLNWFSSCAIQKYTLDDTMLLNREPLSVLWHLALPNLVNLISQLKHSYFLNQEKHVWTKVLIDELELFKKIAFKYVACWNLPMTISVIPCPIFTNIFAIFLIKSLHLV